MPQWLAPLTMKLLARVRSRTKAVGTQLTQLFILPNGLVDKWVARETLGKVNCGNLDITVAVSQGNRLISTTSSKADVMGNERLQLRAATAFNKLTSP